MKRILAVVLCVALLAVCVCVPAAAEDPVTVSASSASGRPGNTVTINLSISQVTSLGAYTFIVNYDPAVLKFPAPSSDPEDTGITTGSMAKKFLTDQNVDAVNGKITLGGITVTGVTGSGVMYTLSFAVLDTATPTTSAIRVTVDNLATDELATIPSQASNGSVTVLDDSGVFIDSAPTKTSYLPGEAFDAAGLAVSERVKGQDVTNTLTSDQYTLSGFDSETSGVKTVTVTSNATKNTASFNVTVAAMQSLLVTPPTHLSYAVGQAFNPAGMTVIAQFPDGKQITLNSSQYTLSGFTSEAVSPAVTVTVSAAVGGITKTAEFPVSIVEVVIPEKIILKDGAPFCKQDALIYQVMPGTTVSQLCDMIEYSEYLEVYGPSGNKLAAEDKIMTDAVIKLVYNQEVKDSATISVLGDVDGNGIVNPTDALLTLRAAIKKIDCTKWSPARQKALEVTADKTLSPNTALIILRYSIGSIKTFPVVPR